MAASTNPANATSVSLSATTGLRQNRQRAILKAQFSKLVTINFQIDDQLLKPLVPPGLELDYFEGETYVSLIAMTISGVKIWGLPFSIVPAAPDVSLRFYVRRSGGEHADNGTCLIKDYVGGATLAWYLESQFKSKFKKIKFKSTAAGFGNNEIPEIEYQWKAGDQWNKLRVRARSQITKRGPDTKVGFILDHMNYFASVDGRTLVYQVERPRWEVWDAAQANFNCNVERMFGRQFVRPLAKRPASVFVTAGSPVTVYKPITVR